MATQIHTSVLALGANQAGSWGLPEATLDRTMTELRRLGLRIAQASPVIVSRPVGPVRQPSYRNCVVRIDGTFSPARVLRSLKALERAAGRHLGPRWGPRPLDIDIICVGGRSIAGQARRSTAARLSLPHPAMHSRDFVLGPMAEVAPHWRHPRFGLKPRELLLQRTKPRPVPGHRQMPRSRRNAAFRP